MSSELRVKPRPASTGVLQDARRELPVMLSAATRIQFDLPLDRIDFWYVYTDVIGVHEAADRFLRWLSAEEVSVHRQLVFEPDCHMYLMAHALMRLALSHYLDVPPGSLSFQREPGGKPILAVPAQPPLQFNLSHTRGVAVCAVTMNRPVGVDVEERAIGNEATEIARRHFSQGELARLERLPAKIAGRAALEYCFRRRLRARGSTRLGRSLT